MDIEKGVPIPESTRGPRRKYPFSKMEVGDSVLFADEPSGSQSKPAIAAHVWARSNNAKFTARKEGTGVRIWRVA